MLLEKVGASRTVGRKRKTKDGSALAISVIGLSSGARGCDVNSGVGKSSFCSRFVRPSFDSYEAVKNSLCSYISEQDFAHSVINNSHFLYYPPVRLPLEKDTKVSYVTFHITEHTVFTNDATFKPFQGAERYVERATQQFIRSDGKMAFTSRDRIGDDSYETETFPSEVFRNVGVKGFVCVYDPTLEGQRKYDQETLVCQLIKRIKAKVKAAIVLVVVKSDLLSSGQAMNHVAGAKLIAQQFKIPLIFASAHSNVNVRESFTVLAKMVLHKELIGRVQMKTLTDYAEADEEHIQKSLQIQKDYGILLCSFIRNLELTWSTLEPKLKGRVAFDQFVHTFGKNNAKVVFQTRILQVAVEEWNKKWGVANNSADKDMARAIKQEVLTEMLHNHEDFSQIGESDYDFIPLLEDKLPSSNEYQSVSDLQGHSLIGKGTVKMTSAISHSIPSENGAVAQAFVGDSLLPTKSSSEDEFAYESPQSDDDLEYEDAYSDSEHDYEVVGEVDGCHHNPNTVASDRDSDCQEWSNT
ncbi:rho GTPase-activating protein 35-like isoform X2 [Corticium candelabrum]|nr:rho GTPase-activating protein 35-like isoform X2 [Corticium candelabrum]